MREEIQNPSDRALKIFGVSVSTVAIVFTIWTVVGFSFALRSYGWSLQNNVSFPFWGYVSQTLIDFYLYALASPLVFRLARRFRLESGRYVSSIFFHALAGLLFTLTVAILSPLIVWSLGLQVCQECPPIGAVLLVWLTSPIYIHQGFLTYWAIVLVAHGLSYYREMRDEKLRVSRLSSMLSDAKLAALKMQIHPHFLFNTLNSILVLVKTDSDAAERMITKLSAFLRMTLNSHEAPTVSLSEELQFIETYLAIEQVRFGDRLTVELHHEESVLSAKVPNLILQPIVENSVRHGINNKRSGGFITVASEQIADRLTLSVIDNGAGYNGTNGKGLGLENVKGRLKQYYGDDFAFSIAANSFGGTSVKIEIPFTT